MSQQFQPNSSHLSFVNPLDVFTGNWVLARRSINLPGLVVEHQVYLPNELEALFTQHVLGFHLNDGNLQEMTQIGERSYSGTFPKGSSFLIPADVPSLMAWKSADEGLAFVFEPAFLCQIAEQDGEMDANRVELIGTPFTHDAQNDVRAQMSLALDNVERILSKSGYSLTNVVRLNVYTCDVEATLKNYDVIVQRLQAAGCQPPGVFLGVTRLAFPEALVEIEVTATK